ncbi:MAG: glycoside hydrolase family 127 protein [Clostridia bacterium]|nr:glycoside hydrolase family 127 protein [Clostridia bacterium]
MSTIKELYSKNPVYTRRADKDELFLLPGGSAKFCGVCDEAIRFVAENQCKNKHNWILFAEQFKSNVDDENNAWRSEYWGKMMRGAAFTYAYTQDEELYDMLTDTVKDLLSAQDDLGRITSYSVENEFNGWDIWGRKYVLLGLQYYMDICKDEDFKKTIVTAMSRTLDYIISKIGRESEGKIAITKTSNFWKGLAASSLLEPVVRMYNITGKKEYLEFADYIVENGGIEDGNIYELAYEGKLYPYQYPVTKAYEMMSNFEGLMEYYRVTGIEKWRVASCNFGKLVAESDLTIIGSSGCTHELFDHSTVKQANTQNLIIMQETCVTVTWIKFITQVLLLCGDAYLVDQIETSVYNALLGAINTEHSNALMGFTFDSYSPLLMNTRARQNGGTQRMRNNTEVYGCCVAIGAAGTGHIPSIAVMARRDGVAVNLYEKGEVCAITPTGKSVKLTFDTEYPYDGKISIRVAPAKAEKFTVALRIPAWSAKTSVKVNGKSIKVKSGYTEITREWTKGDEISMELDMRVRIVDAPVDKDDKNSKFHKALVRGPIVLARDARLGEEIDSVVDFATDKNGFAVVKPTETAKFFRHLEYAVKQNDGSYIHMVDYASAGKTWRRDSIMTAWMPTKNYWKFSEEKPVTFYMGEAKKYLADNDGIPGMAEEAQKWKIERDGFYVRLKNCASGKYLAMTKHNDTVKLEMKDKCECDCLKWTLTKAVLNRFSLENKLFGLQLFYDRQSGGLILEAPFSEHFVYDTCVWREFALKN